MLLVFNNIRSYFSEKRKITEIFFIVFYTVGVIGTSTPFSHQLFLKLFPLALLMSFTAIIVFHQEPYNSKTIAILSFIGIASFFIEVIGVNTHLIFGNYRYGNALGIKLFNTPLIIAINWVMLIYAGNSVAGKYSMPIPVKIIVSSGLVLLYDLLLEQIAPVLDMWYWEDGLVPFQNYIAWFVIAVIFQTFISFSGIKTHNSIAYKIIRIQVLFFVLLIVVFKIIK